MATTTIPWNDGSGDNITLTYDSASGNQTVTVSSNANTGSARSKTVTFTAGVGNITQVLTIAQEAAIITTIPYIRGGADGSYIDTGIAADSTTKVVVWARNWNPGGGNLFGSRQSGGKALGLLISSGAQYCNAIRVYSNDYSGTAERTSDVVTKLSGYHKYELNGNKLYIDDVLILTASTSSWSHNYNIHLFGSNDGDTHTASALPIDICAAKIYKNNVLVRDFTATNTPSVGLYDSVSGTVFTNAGSSSFSYGTFNPNAYTPLEYISCSNAQWIDTGLYGTKTLPVICKFRVTNTTLSNPNIFGAMRSGTAGTYFLLQLGNSTSKNRYANFYIDGSTSNQIYNNNSNRLTNRDLFFVKTDTQAMLMENNSLIGTTKTFSASSSFVTPDTILLANINNNGSPHTNRMYGYLYYCGFGSERNYVPAIVNNVAGMYDTYNDVFHPSASETAFTAGPEL